MNHDAVDPGAWIERCRAKKLAPPYDRSDEWQEACSDWMLAQSIRVNHELDARATAVRARDLVPTRCGVRPAVNELGLHRRRGLRLRRVVETFGLRFFFRATGSRLSVGLDSSSGSRARAPAAPVDPPALSVPQLRWCRRSARTS